MLVLSTETNPVVQARCDKLSIPVLQGVEDKGRVLEQYFAERGIDAARTVFVGNDVNDLPCFPLVACAVVVGDAHPQAMMQADVVLKSAGGRGALRELSDRILGREEGRNQHAT